ncbi:MAG: VWA domain-containing protein [Candidatus Pacebacteria bacterium]|nr:VWA domain-containing protein [Candidatus Paceibacterota bacterium]
MEGISIIEAKKAKKEGETTETGNHTEAFAFVEANRDFFEHYAKGKIKIEQAPEGLETFAFNLENNTIYINSMFYEKLGFSKERTIFATLHEIEHFLEKIQMLSEDGGEKNFEKYIKKIETSKAFGLMDNCVADIRENRTVVSKTNKGMKDLEENIYKEVLFPETDFTDSPRHIQFCQAILREARVEGEQCNVSPEVRQKLDELKKVKGLMNIMTNPETPISVRLKLQDKYIWPKVEELLEKDIEDKKNKENENENKPSDSNRKKGDSKDTKPSENENTKDQKSEKSDKDGEQKGKPEKDYEKGQPKESDPNKIFADDYEKAEKKVPNAMPVEDVKKALKEWKEEKQKNSPDKADEEYAEKLGVEKKDLQKYRRIAEALQKIVNPETNVGVMEELKNLFSRIIAKRLKERLAPKYPVEEGDELSDPAQLVSDVKSGNLSPKVWEDTEIKEKKGDRFGEIEITLVCDRSSSMTDGDGQKAVEQRNSAVLMMEVLKDFAEMCDEEKMKVDKPLEVKSEIYSFANSTEDKTPIKKMGKDLGEAERINVLKKLFDLPGSTTDFNCLEAINEGLEDETKQKIAIGEIKKIVFVFTDGGSNNVARVQKALKSLRDAGMIVIGIGLTEAGLPAVTTYAPNAQVVNNVTDLPVVLGELLKEHLKDI